MAISSVGYKGSVNDLMWAVLHPAASSRPSKIYGGDITIVGSATRTIRIPSGRYYGWGVLDTITGNNDLVANAISSGTRWDTLVLRKDWTAKATTMLIVPGTSTKAVSADVETTPGVKADHVLGLLLVDSRYTTIQEWVPLVEWGFSLMFRYDTVMPAPIDFPYGQPIMQNNGPGMDIAVRRGGGGSENWDALLCRKWTNLALASGWKAVTGRTPQWRVVGDMLQLRGAVTKTDGSFLADTYVTVGSVTVDVAKAGNFPAFAGATAYAGSIGITTAGAIQVAAGTTLQAKSMWLDGISHSIGA